MLNAEETRKRNKWIEDVKVLPVHAGYIHLGVDVTKLDVMRWSVDLVQDLRDVLLENITHTYAGDCMMMVGPYEGQTNCRACRLYRTVRDFKRGAGE